MTDVLFVLRRRAFTIDGRADPEFIKNQLSTGLYNSANFVHEMLVRNGVDSQLVVVDDNNCIDREVARYRPRIVIIEAIWVVPEKFSVLQRLHPNVQWVIRIHSDIPFMACEGVAMDWILDYVNFSNVRVAPNSPKMMSDIETVCMAKYGVLDRDIIYLPNYYPTKMLSPKGIDYDKPWVDVSCFGAIRPLKNQLIQAVAAVDFVQKIGVKRLKLHMNTGRVESNGMPVDNNLRGLFGQLDPRRYELIFHRWASHEKFIEVAGSMDVAMQMSFSETFNIVGADQVSNGVAFVGCDEVPWYSQGPTSLSDTCEIRDRLLDAYENPVRNVKINQYDLRTYAEKSERIWLEFMEAEKAYAS